MKISVWKKAAVWALSLMMTVSITACGGKNGVDLEKVNLDCFFSTEDIDMSAVKGKLATNRNQFIVEGDKVYFFTCETSENDSLDESDDAKTEDVDRIYSMNIDGTDIEQISEFKLDGNEDIMNLIIDKDKNIMFFSEAYDSMKGRVSYYMSKIGKNGELEDHADITKSFVYCSDGTYISGVYADDKGNYIAFSDSYLCVLDNKYEFNSEIDGGSDYIQGFTKTSDGRFLCAFQGDINGNSVIKELDIENKKLGEPAEINLNYVLGLINGVGEYDFCYISDNGIYGYSNQEKNCKMVVDLLASSISSDNVDCVAFIDSEKLLVANASENKLEFLKKADASKLKDKTVITIGSLSDLDFNITKAAMKFNKENDKYRIVFKDYSVEADPQTKFNTDVLAGNVPDILYLRDMPVERYVAKGVLEDLNPYLDKDDVVKRDDIIPSVLSAIEDDGKLYYIAPDFSVSSLVAKKSDVGDKMGWTVEEFKALLDEKGEGVSPLCNNNKTDVLELLISECVNDYIDWNNGECQFNGESFKSLLEIAGRGSDEEPDYDSMDFIDTIRSGKSLLSIFPSCNAPDMHITKEKYGCDVTFIGYPCEDKQGSYFAFTSEVGIYSQSKVKDGAWEFIRTILTKDYQIYDEYYYWGGCPTNKDAFETYMKSQTATKPYVDEYGWSIAPNYMNCYTEGDNDINYAPLSSDEEKQFRDLVNNTTKVMGDNEEVMNIICEEAGAYFSGQKSLDETADIIQNRVTNYVNEIR